MSCTPCRQLAGTASGASRRSVSGELALLTTARLAWMVRPPRSRTPAGPGGSLNPSYARIND